MAKQTRPQFDRPLVVRSEIGDVFLAELASGLLAVAQLSHAVASPPSYLTVDDVADLTKFHPEVIRRAIRVGDLKATKPCGRLRISIQELDRWLDRSAVKEMDAV
jgi:excisionase family DNA binding protein